MRIVILRGGGGPRRRTQRGDTADRGVTALGTDDGHWVLLNVSAAVSNLLSRDTPLPQCPGLPDAAVRAVVLTDAQLEHAGGLLGLRCGAPIDLYATPPVFEELTTTMPVLQVLEQYCGVHWRPIPVAGDRGVASFGVAGMPTLEFTAIATHADAPLHSARRGQPVVGDSIALAVLDHATGQRVFCAPGLDRIGPSEFDWMQRADCLLLDEPAPPTPDAPGDDETWFELLSGMPARHKVMFGSASGPRRAELAGRGIALAYDGMEIVL